MSHAALTAFTADERLGRLEELLQRPRPFNILSALRLARQELAHSDLLAYLLDPARPHGLGSAFCRALVRRVALAAREAIDADQLALTPLIVRREQDHIDILIESPGDRLVIVIENKVDSGEHSDQLTRYAGIVSRRYHGWRALGIFLTLEGAPPQQTRDGERYVALGYGDVAEICGELASSADLAPDVAVLLRHYAQLIRSELVTESDSDVGVLGRQLYLRHRQAIEAMTEARDARLWMIQRCVGQLFEQTRREQPGLLVLDKPYSETRRSRWHTRFAPKAWYRPELEISSNSWTKTRLLLVFEWIYEPERIDLLLTVGPSESSGALRQTLYELAQHGHAPLTAAWNSPVHEYFTIYNRSIVTPEERYFETMSDDELRARIQEHWRTFLRDDLPASVQHLGVAGIGSSEQL